MVELPVRASENLESMHVHSAKDGHASPSVEATLAKNDCEPNMRKIKTRVVSRGGFRTSASTSSYGSCPSHSRPPLLASAPFTLSPFR